MKLEVTHKSVDPNTGRKFIVLNGQFGVVLDGCDDPKGLDLVVIGTEEELACAEEMLISNGVEAQLIEAEETRARNKVLFAYNAYIDNIGIVV